MHKVLLIKIYLLAGLLAGCGSNDTANKILPETHLTPKKISDIEPRLQQFDSLTIMLYEDPFGSDAERYTRFYKIKSAIDSSNLYIIKAQLQSVFVKSDTLRNCRSEGKMYLFDKGKIKQTLYFAASPQACRHVYLIHEGAYYYMALTPAFAQAMPVWKKEAEIPD